MHRVLGGIRRRGGGGMSADIMWEKASIMTTPLTGRLAGHGYVAYLVRPRLHLNAATSHAGCGPTPEEAADNCCYWENQLPWVRVVPWGRAPRWAQEEATEWAK